VLLGTVIGNVWCTKKLQGPPLVCADQAGAGPGDQVLVVSGGGARVAAGAHVPVDAAIVGIVDHVER